MFIMQEQELRQWEPIGALISAVIGLTLGVLLKQWGWTVLGCLLVLSQLWDAHTLRCRVRAGKVWVYEGTVKAVRGKTITLDCGQEQVILVLTRKLPLKVGSSCRFYLDRSKSQAQLLGFQKLKPTDAPTLVAVRSCG